MASVMKCGKVRTWLEAGWGFITLGLALTIVAFLLGVVYFSIRAITTSLEHIDIVPTYATALLVSMILEQRYWYTFGCTINFEVNNLG